MLVEGKQISLMYDMHMEEATYAVKNIDIQLKSNEIIGIMGPSGSGKSSLLYLLSGLKAPTTGTVYYDDIDIQSFTPEKRAKLRKENFGFIFQRHFLIDYLSVLDNILSAVNRSDRTTVEKAMGFLDRLKIGHLARKMPFQLSGGQRQRTAIARALMNDPCVIFADEPTACLDHTNAREVMNVLEEMKNQATILVVTHDRSILENADRVVEIWDGHIK